MLGKASMRGICEAGPVCIEALHSIEALARAGRV
jgi:hypothetical protein